MNSNLEQDMSPSMIRWCQNWMDATGIQSWERAIEAYYGKYQTSNLA